MFLEKTYINPKIEIRDSEIAGKGMFAKEKIKVGEVVIKWGGEFFTSEEIKGKDKGNFLIIQIDEDLWSMEERGEFEEDYFINHSCDSNVWMIDGRTFVVRKDIEKGEELTADYSLFESGEYIAKWDCHCGVLDCRKKITGKDCLLLGVQARYKGHFSPMVQKRMSNNS